MTRPSDVWECSRCGHPQGRHDMWFDGDLCEKCSEYEHSVKCRGCETIGNGVDERCDAYGYGTGDWCDVCYNSNKYPYRKDRYFDPSYAGERLEDDY